MTKKYRILIILSLLLVTGFLATSLVSYFSARDSLAHEIEESSLPLTGDNIYSEIQQDLLRPIFISSLMAHDTFFRDWVLAGEGEGDSKQVQRYLKEIQERYDTDTAFFVSEATRRYYHPSGVIKTLDREDPQDRWYFNFKSKVDPYEINIDKDTSDPSKITVFINYKVYDYRGNFIGAAGVGLSTSVVKKLIDNYQHRYNREIFFTNREGMITMHSDAYTGAASLQNSDGLKDFSTRILTSPSSSFNYTIESGHTVYVNSRLVPEFNWYLIVQQTSNPVSEKIFKTLIINLIGAVVITIIVLVLAGFTVNGFQKRLETMALTDKLTGLANRQMLEQALEQQLAYARRKGTPLSCVIADLDGFKQINDRYGHPTGDLMIKACADVFRSMSRSSDLICRWGGDEFLFLLNDCDHNDAAQFAEKIRCAIEQNRIRVDGEFLNVSLSLGVAQLHESDQADDLILRADHALLTAKSNGRNQVTA